MEFSFCFEFGSILVKSNMVAISSLFGFVNYWISWFVL